MTRVIQVIRTRMGYTDLVPEYSIDLELPAEVRWNYVMEKEADVIESVLEDILGGFMEAADAVGGPFVRWLFSLRYRLNGGRYYKEMREWANRLEVDTPLILAGNCSYELAHAFEVLEMPFGCTAGIKNVPGVGLVHVRSMDWPESTIGEATRLFRFKKGDREFVSVGILGMVAVLSGMLPGAYSITLNWAPPNQEPSFDYGPAFLIRRVLEKCDTFDDAVRVLSKTRLATSAFFTVCGAKPGEACVIERTRGRHRVRWISSGRPLIQANHHVSRDFLKHNGVIQVDEGEGTIYNHSKERADTLRAELRQNIRSLDDAAECLDVDPVRNEESYQQMVFCPKTGDIKVWRWV